MTIFPQHELHRAAGNLAKNNVNPGEDVLIVTSSDQDARLVDSLTAAVSGNNPKTVSTIVIACPETLKNFRHPDPVLAAVEHADLTIVATTINFPRAYDDLSEVVYKSGKRQVLINNAPLEDFVRGASLADPVALDEDTRKLARRISDAKKIRVTSNNGTDLCMDICRPCISLTGFADREMGFGSFPSGEAMLVPEEDTADGTFVADSFGQVVYIDGSGPQIGLISEPIELHFAKGNLVEINSGRDSQKLKEIIKAGDKNVTRLAELGIGTNPMAREIGHVENKFRKGTAHIALGDNHLIGWGAVKKYGGQIISNRHIDLVANNIALQLDAEVIEF